MGKFIFKWLKEYFTNERSYAPLWLSTLNMSYATHARGIIVNCFLFSVTIVISLFAFTLIQCSFANFYLKRGNKEIVFSV